MYIVSEFVFQVVVIVITVLFRELILTCRVSLIYYFQRKSSDCAGLTALLDFAERMEAVVGDKR